MRRSVLLLLVPLVGCTHSLLVINVGIANKSAASLAPLTPEEYCMALTSQTVVFKGKPVPHMTQETEDYCREVLKKKEAKP